MKKILICCYILSVLILSGCDSCTQRPKELIHIAAIKSPSAFSKVSPMRLQMIRETATTVGAQGGLAYRSEQINCVLKKNQENLERIYNFRALLLKNDVLPPVLEEGRGELALDDCNTIRAADRIIRIVLPPCFVTAPPTWRDYLWMRYYTPEQQDVSLLPKNSDEAAIWNCYVNLGWQQGFDQANQIFGANLLRLKRDYNGMILYRVLLAQNMVTAPYVCKTDLGVTGDGNEMRINDRVLRISATSQLNTNPDTWRPVVAPPCPAIESLVSCCRQPPPPPAPKIIKKQRSRYRPGMYLQIPPSCTNENTR